MTLIADETSLLTHVEKQGPAMIETVKEWSSVNSGSFNPDGLEAMRERLNTAFAELGGSIEALPTAPGERVTPRGEIERVEYTPAFKLTQRPDAPVQVVLTGHHDTVFPPNTGFDEWRLLDENTINGPGCADMKGGLLVMREALLALERSPWRDQVGYRVLISPDEEIGNPGSAPHLKGLGETAHIGLTFEPALADGSLAGARKGSGNFSVIFRGRAAHAGREHAKGRNAMEAAAQFVVALQALNGQRDEVTFNVSKIDGGGPPNMVPDRAVVRFNVRVKETEDTGFVLQEVDRLIAIANRTDGISAHSHGGFTRPPKPMAPPVRQVFEWVRDAGSDLDLDITWNSTGGVCEGNNLWAAGCPNVDTLGVCGGNLHSHEEFALLSSFGERAQLAALVLLRIAQGRYDAVANRARVHG